MKIFTLLTLLFSINAKANVVNWPTFISVLETPTKVKSISIDTPSEKRSVSEICLEKNRVNYSLQEKVKATFGDQEYFLTSITCEKGEMGGRFYTLFFKHSKFDYSFDVRFPLNSKNGYADLYGEMRNPAFIND